MTSGTCPTCGFPEAACPGHGTTPTGMPDAPPISHGPSNAAPGDLRLFDAARREPARPSRPADETAVPSRGLRLPPVWVTLAAVGALILAVTGALLLHLHNSQPADKPVGLPVITPSAGDSSSPATEPAKTRERGTPPADRSSPRRSSPETRTPTASPSRDDSAYLEPGEEGAQVAYLQQDLVDLGFYGKDGLDAGGRYGPLTAAAVTSLRNSYGVMDDGGEGVAGPKTLAKIRELTERG